MNNPCNNCKFLVTGRLNLQETTFNIHNKPHWETLHEWKLSNIYFELWQIWQIKMLLRKHPDDEIGVIFRDIIKLLKKLLALEIKKYEKIYGDKPNIREMRDKVEKGLYKFN